MSKVRRFWIWKESTCWVCQHSRADGRVGPTLHARENLPSSWEGHSPCTTQARPVWAENRRHALLILRGIAGESPQPIPWYAKAFQTA